VVNAAEQVRTPSDRAAKLRVILAAYGEPAQPPQSLPTRTEESPSSQPTAKEAAAPERERLLTRLISEKLRPRSANASGAQPIEKPSALPSEQNGSNRKNKTNRAGRRSWRLAAMSLVKAEV
jgi:hypothetical protein